MNERVHLLPQSSTKLEVSVSEAIDRQPEIGAGSDELRAFKFTQPNDTILPFMIVEYALGSITPFFDGFQTTIDHGIPWSRLKGTPESIHLALSWLSYDFDTLDEAPTRRIRWHLFDLDMSKFWDTETDLDKIESVVRLSEPARSQFWRGYDEYNVHELDWAWTVWGDTIWGDDSGVRLHEDGVKWSFGRTHEVSGGFYSFTEGELTALGVWIVPSEDNALSWGNFPWTTENATWSSSGITARASAIYAGLVAKSFWVALRRDDDSVIGYRKARSVHSVSTAFDGCFTVDGLTYEPTSVLRDKIYVEAMTDFGEGEGETISSWLLVIDGDLPVGAKPGVLWLEGDTLVGGTPIGEFSLSEAALIGQTDRERFRGIFRIDA